MKHTLASILASAAFGLGMTAASAAPAVLNTGTVSMGVKDDGSLGASSVGFVGPTGDAITPGCLCEGWGAAANGVGNYTYGDASPFGISSATLTTTQASGLGLSAQSVVNLANGLQVIQTYSAAAGGTLFRVNVELKNISGAAMTDVRYARTLDWDVTPGFYVNNYTTVYGGTPTGPGGKVLHTSTNPFGVPNPMTFRSQDSNTNVVNKIGDLGGYFVFGFGALGIGQSTSFDTYIGAADTSVALLSALGSVGVEAYSFTTGNQVVAGGFGPAYGYGFAGLGLPPAVNPVPEPASLALVGLGLAGLAAARRRKQA